MLKASIKFRLSIILLTVSIPIFSYYVWSVSGSTDINVTINTSDLASGLVGHWTFDGEDITADQIIDRSGQENHGGFLNGATTSATTRGKIGQALEFDGDDDYVVIPNSGNLNSSITTEVAISAWIKADGSSFALETGIVTEAYNQASIDNNVVFAIHAAATTKVTAGFYSAGWKRINQSGDFSFGRWVHVVGTYDGSIIKLYIDGVLDNTLSNATGLPTGTDEWRIGRRWDLSTEFDGLIDDVRIYNRALSEDEITRLYHLGATTHLNTSINTPDLASGLVGHWTFDGPDLLQNAVDKSGSGNTGYLQGFTSGTTTTRGRIGQALQFTAAASTRATAVTNDESNPLVLREEVTISAWINFDRTSESPGTIVRHGTGVNNIFSLFATTVTPNLYFEQHDGVAFRNAVTAADTISFDKWQHVVAVRDADGVTVRFYIDGVFLNESVLPGAPTASTPNSFNIGAHAGSAGQDFSGTIDDVRIYNRALSEDEITRLYHLGATTHLNTSINTPDLESDLVGHWTLDGEDITADQILDRSGQGNHGGFLNGATTSAATRGKIGQALAFDGSNDYVQITSSDSLDLSSTAYTISLWANLGTSQNSFAGLISKGDGTANDWVLQKSSTSNNIAVFHSTASVTFSNMWGEITGAGWKHVVLTYNETSVELFIDAVPRGTQALTAPTQTSGRPVKIGAERTGIPVNGVIDDVRIYNRALSAEEIKRLYELGR